MTEPEVRELAKEISYAMRWADAPLNEAQAVTLYQYLLARFGE